MDLESTSNNTVAKFPLLKQGDYEMWKLRIEQYFQIQDYALWEVIEYGNSFKPVPRTTTNADGTSTLTISVPITSEEKTQKKNDLKARSMLLMALPNEHLLTFSQYEDAKTLFEAIKARFGMQLMLLRKHRRTTLKHNTATLSDATIYAFLANQPKGSQVVHEDLEQIHDDDLEEMDLKWQLALLSVRARKKITINGSDTAGFDKSKVECFNCHKLGHFARECKNQRSQENRSRSYDSKNRNQESSKRIVNIKEITPKAMVAVDGTGFDWSFMADEEVPTNMALMAFSDSEACLLLQLLIYLTLALRNFNFLSLKGMGLRLIRVLVKIPQMRLRKLLVPQLLKIGFEIVMRMNLKMVQKPVMNNGKRGTGQREVRPVWNNAMRTNHQNFSNSRRNFAPTVVLTKSGIVPISTARQSSPRVAAPVSTARPNNTAAPKPFVNVAKPKPNIFQKSYSPSKRPINQQTALKNRILNNKVYTAKVNSVNTAKGNKVTSAVGEQGINAVKSSTCWVWRPKRNGDPQVSLKDTRIFDSGCSRLIALSISQHNH
ncbi:ribonuclease H-like domain-containing protein [Tanacetum coccineum]